MPSIVWVFFFMVIFVPCVLAQESVTIIIKGHIFEPSKVMVPIGKKIKLIIDNQDETPEEFESYALNREKVIPGKKQGFVFIGPLKKGTYDFFGEFNRTTANGSIVVE